MKHKITAGITALMMLTATVPMAALPETALIARAEDSGSCGVNLTWTLDDEGTLTISGTGGMYSYSGGSPWSSSLSKRRSIKKVIVQDGVTSLSQNAFSGCSNLTAVTLPDSLTAIVGSVFTGCTALTSINIPESVKSIEGTAFSGTQWLTDRQEENPLVIVNNILINGTTAEGDVTIPDGVTSIGDGAFQDCNLTSVTIPDSVTSIGASAFASCMVLTSTTIPDSVTSIGVDAFWMCDSLTSVTLPNSITRIEESTFHYCSALTSINIPDSVTSIGEYAFFGCNLTSITIPESVKSIEDIAFSDCDFASVKILNPECQIGFYAISCKSGGIIYGYDDSTAQAYAERYNYKFESLGAAPVTTILPGDTDGDGAVAVKDIIALQKYILGIGKLKAPDAADLNGDGVIDVFDLGLLKRLLLSQK